MFRCRSWSWSWNPSRRAEDLAQELGPVAEDPVDAQRDEPSHPSLVVHRVDGGLEPEAARAHQVIAAPTLVKLSPAPVRRIIGDLGDTARLLHGLGIEARSEASGE